MYGFPDGLQLGGTEITAKARRSLSRRPCPEAFKLGHFGPPTDPILSGMLSRNRESPMSGIHYFRPSQKHSIVFSIRQQIVIGPTPPGTGDDRSLRLDCGETMSPHNFPVSGSRFTPTSITTAPSRTMSAVTNFGRPIATTRISARRVTSGRLRAAVRHRHRSISSSSSFDTGSPHDIAAADHHGLLARNPEACGLQHLDDALRRTGSVQGCFYHKAATFRDESRHVLGFTIASIALSSSICSAGHAPEYRPPPRRHSIRR